MVIGSRVTTVQRVSSYCLKQGAEVFPYYGIPTDEELTLFAPDVLVLCLPIPENFLRQINHRYILWLEDPIDEKLPWVTTFTELDVCLREVLLG
ncbi:hypothetical protein SD80_023515 [Scytonema tolypothrichoides VB-61278]|nr:hypothetical protein SD80_023515 [Scytonema tolypothrichoides VB-61278]